MSPPDTALLQYRFTLGAQAALSCGVPLPCANAALGIVRAKARIIIERGIAAPIGCRLQSSQTPLVPASILNIEDTRQRDTNSSASAPSV